MSDMIACKTCGEYPTNLYQDDEIAELNAKVAELERLIGAIWLQLDRGDRESVSDDELCGIVRTYVVGCARQLYTVKELRQQVTELEKNAKRYERLRIVGCAPLGHEVLNQSLVIRFQSLDEWVDSDIKSVPSRGEFAQPSTSEQTA